MTVTRPPRADVRAALVATAAELFVAQGYAATSLAQVAAAAGFTKGAVYSNFGGKPELFAAAVAEPFTARATAAVEAAIRPGSAGAALDDQRAAQLTAVITTDAWSLLMTEFRQLAAEDPAVTAAYAAVRQAQQASLARLLADHAEELRLPADLDLDATAALLLVAIAGFAVEHRAAPQVTTVAGIEAALAVLLRSVRS